MEEKLKSSNSFAGAMINAGRKELQPTGKTLFYEKDIESAVEWAKQKINKLKVENALVKADVYEILDKAFPDII